VSGVWNCSDGRYGQVWVMRVWPTKAEIKAMAILTLVMACGTSVSSVFVPSFVDRRAWMSIRSVDIGSASIDGDTFSVRVVNGESDRVCEIWPPFGGVPEARHKMAIPYYAIVPDPADPEPVVTHAAGWPVCWTRAYARGRRTLGKDMEAPGIRGFMLAGRPITPVPMLFVANTGLHALPWIAYFGSGILLYAAIAKMSIALSRLSRRERRDAQGLCLACGYSRRGLGADSPCPECGSPRMTPAPRPASTSTAELRS